MKQGIQSFLLSAGNYACYALDIIELAERITGQKFDVIAALELGILNKTISYNYELATDTNNFFMKDPAGFLSILTNQNWQVRKEDASYQPKEGELAVDYWEWTQGHFRLPDWDSLQNSYTVAKGKIKSKRIFRRI